MEKLADIIVIKRNGEDGKSFPLIEKRCTFGRMLNCDIRIQLSNVSKEHCLIQVDQRGQAWLEDTSTNGTLVNGKPVKKHLLHDNDVFTISDRSFRFEYHRPGETKQLKSDTVTPSKANTVAYLSSSSRKNQGFEVNSKENQPDNQQVSSIRSAVKSAGKRTPGLSRVWSVSKTNEFSTRKSNPTLISTQVDPSLSMLPVVTLTPHREKNPKLMSSPMNTMTDGGSSSLRKKENIISNGDFMIHSTHLSEKKVYKEDKLAKDSPLLASKSSLKPSVQKTPLRTNSGTVERTALKIITPNHELQLAPNSHESIGSDEESIPSSPSEKMKNRKTHDSSLTNFDLLVDDLVSANVDCLPTPLKVGQFTPVKTNLKQQSTQDKVMAESTKFRKELIKTPLPKPQNFEIKNRSVSPLQPLQSIESRSSVASKTPSTPKLIPLESKPRTVSEIKLKHETPSRLKEVKFAESPSATLLPIEELTRTNPKSNVKNHKLATPLIKEISQGLKLKSKLEDLKKLSTPLKKAIEEGMSLKEPKKSKSLPNTLKEAIETGIKLKKIRELKALAGPLKQEIENGVSLKPTKKFPKLKTPLKRAIEQPTKLRSIRPTHRLATPLKESIELGHPLKKVNVYKKLMTPLKQEIEQRAKRRSVIRQFPTLPIDLDEAIKKGTSLRKTRGFHVLSTPLKEDIRKGATLKKLKNHSFLATPLRSEIQKGLTLRKTKEFPRLNTPLKESIELGTKLKNKFRVYSRLSTPLKEKIREGVDLKRIKNYHKLSSPLSRDIEKGIQLKSFNRSNPTIETCPIDSAVPNTPLTPIQKQRKLPTPLKEHIERGVALKSKLPQPKLTSPLREKLVQEALLVESIGASPSSSSRTYKSLLRDTKPKFSIDETKRSLRAARRGLSDDLDDDDLRTLFAYEMIDDVLSNLLLETKPPRSLRTRSTSRVADLQSFNEDIAVLPPSTPTVRRATRGMTNMTPSTQSIAISKLHPSIQENNMLSSENDSELVLAENPSLLSSKRVLRSTKKRNNPMEHTTVEATPSSTKRTRNRSSSYVDESGIGNDTSERHLIENWSQSTSESSEPQPPIVDVPIEPVKPATRSRKPRETIAETASISESNDSMKFPSSSQEIDIPDPSSDKTSYATRRSTRRNRTAEDSSQVLAEVIESESSSRRKTRSKRLNED